MLGFTVVLNAVSSLDHRERPQRFMITRERHTLYNVERGGSRLVLNAVSSLGHREKDPNDFRLCTRERHIFYNVL